MLFGFVFIHLNKLIIIGLREKSDYSSNHVKRVKAIISTI